jgi:hypothetical protein
VISSPFAATRALCVVTACALAWPAIAFAQDDAFRRGLDARGDRNWGAVVTQMRVAIASDPKESTRRVGGGLLRAFGGGGMEYLPYYFLGEALFNLTNCVGAVEAWQNSEQQGVVKVRREFVDNIVAGYKKCAANGVLPPKEYNSLLASTRQTVADAMALAERLTKLGQANLDAWRPEINEQYKVASGELQTAQTRLLAGARARSAAEFNEARAAAGRATTVLRGLESTLNASIENITLVRRQIREVDQLIAGAENGDRAIDGVKATLTPELEASRQNGRDLLARARERARAGEKTQNAATVNEAMRAAQGATTVFNEVLDQATKLVRATFERELGEVAAAATEALSFLDASFATLERLVVEKAALAPSDIAVRREALLKRVATLRRRVETAQKTQNIAGLRDAARLAVELRGELDTMITSFGPSTLRDRGVRAALEEGVRLFLAGEHQQALTALDSSELSDAPLQLQVHLFRAAALYHLFVRSGEKDQTLRARAVTEIDECKRIDPGFQPDSRAFAPRFLSFYQNPVATVTP